MEGERHPQLWGGLNVIESLLERARAAAAAIRARVAAVVGVALAAVDVTARVFVMNGGGWFHGRHLLAEVRCHLGLVLHGRPREPGLDEQIVDAVRAAHCTDITDARTSRGGPECRLYTARWALPGAAFARRPPTDVPEPDRNPPGGPGDPAAPRLPLEAGQWDIPWVPLRYDRGVIAGAVLTAQLRTACRAGRDPYDVAFHRQAPRPAPAGGVDPSRRSAVTSFMNWRGLSPENGTVQDGSEAVITPATSRSFHCG